jgi:SAM-dependent methyltransferase
MSAVDSAVFASLRAPAGQRLLGELDGYDEASLFAISSRLRRTHPADLVAAALTQSRLRAKAATKFGADAALMYFTPAGLEQATGASIAVSRARRYARAGVRRVVELCCGVGADTIAFARAGIHVLAVDRDPLTCEMLRANLAALRLEALVEVRCADARELGVDEYQAGDGAVFVDPARRAERGRVFDPDAYSPSWGFVLDLAGRAPALGVKTAPGIPHALLPPGAEAEWISVRGGVKEAGVYTGTLASCRRRATVHRAAFADMVSGAMADDVASLATDRAIEDDEAPPVGAVGRYLYEPDGAVIRAHLVGDVAARLDGRLIDPTIAYITADHLVPTPFATAYEVTDVLPFQLKRLRALVKERDIGTLTIKKRGSAIDPAVLRTQLRPRGANAATLIVTRLAGAPTALLARPACELRESAD